MQEVIWSCWHFENAHAHPQWRKAHTCSECKKSFGQVGHLRRHMVKHTGEKVHKCEECVDSFGQAGDLKRHKLIHSGEKPHKCTKCYYATAQTGYHRDHIKMHSTEKPNKCNWYEFSSITKKDLTHISMFLPHMLSETTRFCTCVITFCALVWLFSSVNADVPLQSSCSVE